MIDPTKIFYFVFGALTIAGGVMGYVKAGSTASIVAGSIAGVLLIVAGALIASGRVSCGLIMGGIVSLVLAIQFVPKFFSAHKFMPAGMMSILSVIGIILTALALFKK
jgi:uncharacterized membrane protein (UPF0136 family)